jgi:hypothetical protein
MLSDIQLSQAVFKSSAGRENSDHSDPAIFEKKSEKSAKFDRNTVEMTEEQSNSGIPNFSWFCRIIGQLHR